MKKMIKKVIAPVLVITVLFAVLRPFCIQDGKCNYFLLLLLMGIPFGIGKMCVWMVPRGFDLGGTLAVWTMNFLIGGLIGSVVSSGNDWTGDHLSLVFSCSQLLQGYIKYRE